jgi:polar amino acid transport system permease protein
LKPSEVLELIPLLLSGAAVTLEVTVLAAGLALLLSFLIGFARMSPFRPLRVVATAYVEILRGSSAMVQLYYLFFILPLFGVELSPTTTAVIGLGLNSSAYGSEIVRASVLNVDPGQWDAARALHLPRIATLVRVILPQAMVIMLPSFLNLLIQLLKGTSLVSLITLMDLTFAGTALITTTGRPTEVWTVVLVLYFLMAWPITRWGRSLELRFVPQLARSRA